MSYILYHFKVEDYARWKSVFDEDPLDRGSNGSNMDHSNPFTKQGEKRNEVRF